MPRRVRRTVGVKRYRPKTRSVRSRRRVVTGRGAYQFTRNSLMMGGPPTVANRKIGGELATQIRHREYIGDISVTIPAGAGVQVAPWQIVQGPLAINPGVYELFPWLSGVAAHYLQYEINGMVIEYVSTSGAAVGASANQSIGSIGMAVQYDSIQAPYQSKQEMLNDQMAVSGAPYGNLLLGVECAPQLTPLTKQYVRTGPPPAGTDQRLYDLGQVYVAVDGIQGTGGTTVTLGELWVSYDVILMKSTLTEIVPDPIPGPPTPQSPYALAHFEGIVGTGATFKWGEQLWKTGTGGSIIGHNNTLGLVFTDDNTLTFPALGPAYATSMFQVDIGFYSPTQQGPFPTPSPFNGMMFNFCRGNMWNLGATGTLVYGGQHHDSATGGTTVGTLGVGTNNANIAMHGQIFVRPAGADINAVLQSNYNQFNAICNLGWNPGSGFQIRVSIVPYDSTFNTALPSY
jgi:hypothetical protein